MINLLHDRIDEQEDFREKARSLVEETVKDKFSAALDASEGDLSKALELVAASVGDTLSGLTTEAVRAGFNHAVKRSELVRG